MKFERDPRDRRYRERLAGSTLASLVLHALLAMLLVGLVMSSSQEGATENTEGGTVVTIERRTPAVASEASIPGWQVRQRHVHDPPVRTRVYAASGENVCDCVRPEPGHPAWSPIKIMSFTCQSAPAGMAGHKAT